MSALRRSLALFISLMTVAPALLTAQATATAAPDPFLWLEEVESDRALSWVRERNARSLGVLEGDARFEQRRFRNSGRGLSVIPVSGARGR